MTQLTTIDKDYSIRLAKHNVQFCNIYPTTELDDIILDLLSLNNGEMSFVNLGLTLGLAVKEIPLDEIHYDQAEVAILEDILETLKRYHLISFDDQDLEKSKIQSTDWGKSAQTQKKKRLFYKGIITLPEHYLIQIGEYENAKFPFKRFGIHSAISGQKECDPFDIQESSNVEDLKKTLAESNLKDVQEKDFNTELIHIEPIAKGYNSQKLNIKVSLFKSSESFEINTAINGQLSSELDKLLQSVPNRDLYQDWLNEARYNQFLETSNLLTAVEFEEYTPFVEWLNILKDNRVVWDDSLLELIAKDEVATQEIWTLVSKIAPQVTIIEYLDKYKKFWNWYILTENLPISFIVAHANDYDWDFDILLKSLETEEIESILTILDDTDAIKDWEIVTEKVSNSFLKTNITEYPFDLYSLSKSTDFETLKLVLYNPKLDWDWSYIGRYSPFEFVVENYNKLLSKLDLKALLIRVLSDSNELEVLLGSGDVLTLFQSNLKNSEVTFSHRDDIMLNEVSLDFLHNNDLLFWGYGKISGIEANPNLYWTASVFTKYHSKVKTDEGYANVSSSIPELALVELHPDFPWNFNILSKRSDLSWSIKFIRGHKEKLSVEELLSHLSGKFVAENLQFFIDWLIECDSLQELSSFVSNKFSFIQIKDNSEQLETRVEEIDWKSVFRNYTQEELNNLSFELEEDSTKVLFITTLWTYLSEHCKLEFIFDHPEIGWNWQIITESRIDESRLNNKDYYSKYAQYLHWPYILSELVLPEDLAKIEYLSSISIAVSKAPERIRKKSWRIITRKIPRNKRWQIISETESYENFTWDWNIISSMDSIPISHQFLNQFAEKINWNLLSKNPYLNKFFRYDRAAYRNATEWVGRCMEYLHYHKEKWNFKALSHLNNLTWNVSIVSEFEDKWDWEIIVLKSNLLTRKNNELNLIEFRRNRLQKFSGHIDWEKLSSLFDVRIPIDLIEKFSNQHWDWSALSSHPKFEITNEFLIANKDKPWDYQALTIHSKLNLNKDLLLELDEKDWDFGKISSNHWVDNDLVMRFQDKDWNWTAMSKNHSLIPDINLIKLFAEKQDIVWRSVLANSNLHITSETLTILEKQEEINSTCWETLSRHQNLDFDQQPKILQSYRDFWQWNLLIDKQKIDVNEPEILHKYQEYIDWQYLSKHELFQPSIEILGTFKEYLDWNFILRKIQLTLPVLKKFKDFLDWSFISAADSFQFTPKVIDEFKLYWDYYILKDNIALSHASRSRVAEIIQEIPELEFYFRLKQPNSNWSGYIYHFTHIQNAFNILDTKKILSRNRAEDIADAAGSVVHRRSTSHDYARFYFRPQTPTQYYNECLGVDVDLRSYEQAKKLGLPKCPVPVFFKFNLQEVLLRMREQCFISNGNMQTNWAKEAPLMQMLPYFNFNDLYSTISDTSDNDWRTYIRYSQQEFLIKDEFDFSELKDYQIIVNSKEAKEQLSGALKTSNTSNKIVLDEPSLNTFHNSNKELNFSYNDEILDVQTNYKGDGLHQGEIHVEFNFKKEFEYMDGSIKEISKNKVKAYPNLTLKISDNVPFQLKFYDDYKNESWLIYSNKVNDNVEIRK